MPHDTPILLRPLRVEDDETFADWATDETFRAHADWTPGLPREEHAMFWRRLAASPPPELLRLVAEADGEVVGTVDLHGLDEGVRELGYTVGPSRRWGQGYGTAVARAGLAYAFDALGLETVWAEALSTNHASVHILERLGMVHDGHGDPGAFLGVPDRYVRFRMSRTLHAATRATGPLTQRLRIP